MSQPSRACLIVCHMEGIKINEIEVSFIRKENRDSSFLKINPLGTVPTLVDTSNNLTITQSTSIVRYLLTIYGKHSLYPVDPIRRAQVDSLLDWNHSQLRVGVTRWVFLKVVSTDGSGKYLPPSNLESELRISDEAVAKYGEAVTHRALQELENYLLTTDTLHIGHIFIMCEIKQLEFLGSLTILDKYPKVKKWFTDHIDTFESFLRRTQLN